MGFFKKTKNKNITALLLVFCVFGNGVNWAYAMSREQFKADNEVLDAIRKIIEAGERANATKMAVITPPYRYKSIIG